MIAKNYSQFPDMLIYQRELELACPAPAEVSERDLSLTRLSFEAAGAYLRTYATRLHAIRTTAPEWFLTLINKAKILAKAIKAAIFPMFP